jgi:NAD/NADP transhydrogenase beta subunit
MVRAWHGTASVNQTPPHCVNQMGKTHSKPLAARHGNGMGAAQARHAVCELALKVSRLGVLTDFRIPSIALSSPHHILSDILLSIKTVLH